jgi:hypothetical protein
MTTRTVRTEPELTEALRSSEESILVEGDLAKKSSASKEPAKSHGALQ